MFQNISSNKRIIFSLIVFFFTIILIQLFAISKEFVNELYPKIYNYNSRLFYLVSKKVPFSMGDILYACLILIVTYNAIKLLRSAFKKHWKDVKVQIGNLVLGISIFYWIFSIVWGFNYHKNPIVNNYNTDEIHLDELKILAEKYLNRSKKLREKVSEDENGVFKFNLNQTQINQEIELVSHKLKHKYPETNISINTSPNIKSSLFSTIFSHLGVAGYYIPFTTESQYISTMPDTKILFTQMHETAHQWGYAAESEANFVGFLLGLESEDSDLNYVSNYRAMRSLLNRILLEDPVYVLVTLIRYSDGMKRDRLYEKQINEKYQGKAEDSFSLMNEAFLRLNKQEGLESYGKFVELLVGFNRKYAN